MVERAFRRRDRIAWPMHDLEIFGVPRSEPLAFARISARQHQPETLPELPSNGDHGLFILSNQSAASLMRPS